MVSELPTEFNQHYQQLYGLRWLRLREALQAKEKQVLYAPFGGDSEGEIDWLAKTWWYIPSRTDWVQLRNQEQNLIYYVMDPASVLVAKALAVQPGDHVLDMCAAPGGKTLVLAQALGNDGRLDANELSAGRRARLTKVIQQYVPRSLRPQIFVRGQDGIRFGLTAKKSFDRVLLDAPCSGERHLIENAKELAQWKPKRIKSLAKKQYGLLAAAIEAVKPGGRIVYSTCALSPEENDLVVARALERKSGVEIVELPAPSPFAERTTLGWMHLPDACGFGPLYFAVLRRQEEESEVSS